MKLAIVIEGDPNSGKTSTIRSLINSYGGKRIRMMRIGWQRLYLNPIFKYLKLDIYCIPSSPSETGIKLIDRFKDWMPEVLIIALQPNGKNYLNSQSFLKNNSYFVLTYSILNQNGILDWERFDNNNKSIKLGGRSNEIINDIRLFINNHKLV
jgi:GTPase SAR1 family protein